MNNFSSSLYMCIYIHIAGIDLYFLKKNLLLDSLRKGFLYGI